MADCSSRSWQKLGRSLVKFLRTGTEMQRSISVIFYGRNLVIWVTTVTAVVVLLTTLVLPWLQLPFPIDRRTNGGRGGGGHRQNSRGIIAKRNGPSHLSNLFSGSPASDLTPTLFSGNSDLLTGPEISLIPTLYYLKAKDRTTGDLTGEALASLHLAREMTSQGKTEKALKIFTHALALDPKHPDILNEYGEFLEKTKKDTILADHMYCKALVHSPTHTKAMSNRQRTLPLVEEIDQNLYNNIDRKRDSLLHIPEGHPGLRRMIHENYFRHIYHATAIEGNTFSLSQTRSFVETRIVISGKSIMEHNEILGMEAALHFLNSSLIKRIGAITIRDIQDIHRRVLGFVDPIGAGAFRATQVFVGDFVPPDASQLDRLMKELIDWLNSDDANQLHPIEMAALAHYKLVYIHPFYDGNGRTSRLLMNLILMQTGYPPIIIPVEQKQFYYQHLQTANDGDVRPFIRFIANCAEQTLDDFLRSSDENLNRTFPELSINHSDDGRTILANEP